MSSAAQRVAVVGGGVIGVACAHYLQRTGCQVWLLDAGQVGKGCSHGNCGFVCPSHVLPLAGPGMIRKTLATLLKPDSPLTIRPRLDLSLWSWLFRFALRCNQKDMLEAGRALQALLNSSRTLYSELFRTESLEAEWEERGLLFVFQSARAMEHHAETDRLMREHFGVGAVRHEGKDLEKLEPALKPGLAGAWHYTGDAHLRPDKLMASWRQRLDDAGVIIQEGASLHEFHRNGRRVQAVESSQGRTAVDAVVVATGAWTPQLRRHLGCHLPIQPGKGYSITLPRPALCPRTPLMFEEHRVAVTPMQSGYRLGSTMEFAGYDATLNRRRLDLLTRGASHYLREPTAEPVLEEWWGWRPMVHDGKPIIGRLPAFDNVLVAAGHGMLGLSMAPATGKLVAELLTGQQPHIDPAPYAATRF
jgi:D-amino-acid dehydrogenase